MTLGGDSIQGTHCGLMDEWVEWGENEEKGGEIHVGGGCRDVAVNSCHLIDESGKVIGRQGGGWGVG